MIDLKTKTKYKLRYTGNFKSGYKRVKKQGKDVSRLKYIVEKLANGLELEEKYKNHMLINSRHYQNCWECHIEPDWLLVYQYIDDELILVLVATGSHSELF